MAYLVLKLMVRRRLTLLFTCLVITTWRFILWYVWLRTGPIIACLFAFQLAFQLACFFAFQLARFFVFQLAFQIACVLSCVLSCVLAF